MNFSINFVLAFAALFLVLGCHGGTQPEVTIYDRVWGGSSSGYVRVRKLDSREDVPDVTAFTIRGSDNYICPTGVWLGFHEVNYDGYGQVIADPTGACQYSGNGPHYVRSLQIVGSTYNFTVSSLTTLPGAYMSGVQTTYFGNTPDVTVPFNALILLGFQDVEVFVNKNYQGLSMCVRPGINSVYNYNDLVNKEGGGIGSYLYDVKNIFGVDPATIKSFRFGCSERSKKARFNLH